MATSAPLPRASVFRWFLLASLATAISALAPITAPSAVAAAPPAGEEDQRRPEAQAIRNALQWLYKVQDPAGHWELAQAPQNNKPDDALGLQFGGRTAMALVGLLSAGENSQTPAIERALEWLKSRKLEGTDSLSMRMQLWHRSSFPVRDRKEILHGDAQAILCAVKTDKPELGLYGPSLDPGRELFNMSCSEQGVLGVWCAQELNFEIPVKYWEVVDNAWRKLQHRNGSWSLGREGDPGLRGAESVSMTAAGLATLLIARDALNEAAGRQTRTEEDADFSRGVAWLSQHCPQAMKEPSPNLAIYNLQRLGESAGIRRFGEFDWRDRGAAHLLKTQRPDGSWGELPETIRAILFLSRCNARIMFNKLQYTLETIGEKTAQPWNQRPRDIANLVAWAQRSLCGLELSWRTVTLESSPRDLHDAPILYLSGDGMLAFSPREKVALKAYIQRGGMVVGHADHASAAFSRSFEKLAGELLPLFAWRELPDDHLIYTCYHNRKNWAGYDPGLAGVSNGARELMVLIPRTDPGRLWDLRRFYGGHARPMAELGANLYLYAHDVRSLRAAGGEASCLVERDEQVRPARSLTVARLEHGPRLWDPEPAGWARLANILHNAGDLELTITPVKLGFGALDKRFKVAHLTGTAAIQLDEARSRELKAFVESGGTLIIDAAGGSADFAKSAEAMLVDLFGEAATRGLAVPLALDHPVYASASPKIERVNYRRFARMRMERGLDKPRLRGIDLGGRTAIFYSAEDLSVGLVGNPVDGIYGYAPDDAARLMRGMLLYAAGAK